MKKENTTSVNIKEFSPESVKLRINFGGRIRGNFEGLILSTPDTLMKSDGTSEVEIRSIIFCNGEPICVWGDDTCTMVGPTPIGKIEGNFTFQIPSQRLAYLNEAKGWSEALYNIATGEYTFKVYAVK